MNEEYVDKIYGSLSEEGWVTVSKDEFKSALSDDAYKQKLYEGLKEEGWLTVDYDEFASSLGGDSMGKPQPEAEVSTELSEESVSDGGGLTETVGASESQEPPREFGLTQEAIDQYKQLSSKGQDLTDKSREQLVEQGATEEQAQESVPFTEQELKQGEERASFILDTTEEEADERLGEIKGEIAKFKGDLEAHNKAVEQLNEAGGTQEEIDAVLARGEELNALRDELASEQEKYAEVRVYKRAQRGGMVGAMATEAQKGAIEVGVGAARLLALGAVKASGVPIPDEVGDELQDKIGTAGKFLELGMYANSALRNDPINKAVRETTKEYIENKYENGTLFDKALLSVARSAPAMATGAVGLVAQSTAAGYDSINQAAGDKLSEDEKMAYATMYGVVVGALERLGMLGTFASKTKLGNFVNRVISEAAKKGTKLTSGVVDDIVKQVATPMVRAAISEGATEGAQEAAGIGMEQAVNTIKDEQIFEDFDYNAALNRIWESAKIGAVAGSTMISPVALVNAAKITANEFRNTKDALRPDVAAASMELVDAKEEAGDITPEQAQEFKSDIAAATEIASELPDNLTDAQSATAFKLIQEKKQLEAAIEGKDKALTVPQQERLKQINEELTNLVMPEEAQKQQTNETQRNEEGQVQPQERKESDEEVETQKEKIDETQEEPLLEGIQDGGQQEEGGQDSAELRPQETEEEIADKTEFEQSLTEEERQSIIDGEVDAYIKLEEAAKIEADKAYEERQQEIEEINREANIPLMEEFESVSINEQDLKTYGDVNWVKGSGRRLLSPNRETPLDVQLQEISDALGYEVTPDEYMEYFKAKIDGRTPKETKPVKSFSQAATRNLDAGLIWLDKIEQDLDKFEKETLGINIPVAVAKTAIKAAKGVLQSAKFGMKVTDVVADATRAAVKAVEESGWYKSLARRDQLKAIIAANDLLQRGTRVDVAQETEGLTQEEQAKQGVVEIVEAYKQKIRDARKDAAELRKQKVSEAKAQGREKVSETKRKEREKAAGKIAEVKEKEKSKRDKLKEIRAQLLGIIETELPKNIKVPKSFVKQVAKATTPRALEIISEKIDGYVESAVIASLKKEARNKVKRVRKKLLNTSVYTNASGNVANLVNVDLSSANIKDLSDIIDVLDNLLIQPVAKAGTVKQRMEGIIERMEQREVREAKPKDRDTIDDTIERANDEEKTPSYRQGQITRAQNMLNNSSPDSEGGTLTVEEVAEIQNRIDEAQAKLDSDLKLLIAELNSESFEILRRGGVDFGEMDAEQRKMVEDLKDAGAKTSSYKYAKLLNDIAVELSYGYAPIAKMQEYINSLDSELKSDRLASAFERAVERRKTKATKAIRESKVLTAVIPDLFKKKGIDTRSLREASRELQLVGWQFWDDFFGTGKAESIYKEVISPYIETRISASFNESARDIGEYSRRIYKGLRGGLASKVSKDTKTKLVMAMTQGYWNEDHGGVSYWGALINNRKMEEQFPDELKEYKRLYEELPKETVEIDGEMVERVDADAYLDNLDGADKELFAWMQKNNQKYLERQRISNERRGEKFIPVNTKYYIPMLRMGEKNFTSAETLDDFVKSAISQVKNPNSKVKSDRGKSRVSNNITPIETDLDLLIREQIFSGNRDYYLYEPFKIAMKTVGKMKNRIGDADANKYITALEQVLPERLKSEFESQTNRFVNNLFSSFYLQALVSFKRLPVELFVETIRMGAAADFGGMGKAAEMKLISPSGNNIRTIMEYTGSPFLKNLFLESMQERKRGAQAKTQVRRLLIEQPKKASEFFMGLPDSLTFGIVWSPSFFQEFERQAGKEFDVRAFNKDAEKYLDENRKEIRKASSYADAKTTKLKGSKTKAGRRQIIKLAPTWLASGITGGRSLGGIKADTNLGRIITTLQNFAFLEQYNISRNTREIIYGENKSRTLATRELAGAIASGTLYTWAMGYLYAAMIDDEEEKERLTSTEGAIDSLISNAVFLAGGRFGNTSKLAILIGAGAYVSVLKKQGVEGKEAAEQVSEITRSRYFAAPIDLSGYNTQADVVRAALPMYNQVYENLGDVISETGIVLSDVVAKEVNGEDLTEDEKTVMALIGLTNSLQKTIMMTQGSQIPFQKEIDRAIRNAKKDAENEESGRRTRRSRERKPRER